MSTDVFKHKPISYNSINIDAPNVLILGDSISIGYTPVIAQIMDGEANIYRPELNCSSSVVYLEHLSEWMDGQKWDVIHFNCGLHDINRNNNKTIKREGKRRVTINEYIENLRIITDMIIDVSDTAIWANTTPIPPEAVWRRVGDEVEYNKAAAKIMQEKGVAINDLYSFILPYTPGCHPALDNVHFTDFGYRKLGELIAEAIRKTY